MTREEAIFHIKELQKTYASMDKKVAEAVDMAIDALSAEAAIGDYPNDLISRSALMEYCSNQKSKSIDNNDIARFPSAEARPTGAWIQKDECADRFCSECDYVVWDSEAEEYNYCPNCGADMGRKV